MVLLRERIGRTGIRRLVGEQLRHQRIEPVRQLRSAHRIELAPDLVHPAGLIDPGTQADVELLLTEAIHAVVVAEPLHLGVEAAAEVVGRLSRRYADKGVNTPRQRITLLRSTRRIAMPTASISAACHSAVDERTRKHGHACQRLAPPKNRSRFPHRHATAVDERNVASP